MSDPDRSLNLIYLSGMLVLVVSALAARRLPLGRSLKMAGAWLLIFAAAIVAIAARDDLTALGGRIWNRVTGASETVNTPTGREIRIRKSEDGHFWVWGRVNDENVHFLIDSGATVTSLAKTTADGASVAYGGDFPVMVNTANGSIIVQRGRAARLEVGEIVRKDFAVHVSEAFGETDVLGMNFLSSLRGWGVEGPWLVLKP